MKWFDVSYLSKPKINHIETILMFSTYWNIVQIAFKLIFSYQSDLWLSKERNDQHKFNENF